MSITPLFLGKTGVKVVDNSQVPVDIILFQRKNLWENPLQMWRTGKNGWKSWHKDVETSGEVSMESGKDVDK
jgi:hypothetical protein